MGRKIVLLFLALILPGLIYVFLKTFGSNKFDVPILYQSGEIEIVPGCRPVSTPYFAPTAYFEGLIDQLHDSLFLIYITKGEEGSRLKRIEIDASEYNVPLLTVPFSPQVKCDFLLFENWNMVLLDVQGRIRGQYDSYDREELDRLYTELDIILMNE